MGLVSQRFGSVTAALAEVHGDGECSCTRADMHGCSTCEIKSTKDGGPAMGVPGPTCNGIVNDCGPNKNEDGNGANMTSFCEATNGDHRSERW